MIRFVAVKLRTPSTGVCVPYFIPSCLLLIISRSFCKEEKDLSIRLNIILLDISLSIESAYLCNGSACNYGTMGDTAIKSRFIPVRLEVDVTAATAFVTTPWHWMSLYPLPQNDFLPLWTNGR